MKKKGINVETQYKFFKYVIILIILFLLIQNWVWIFSSIGGILLFIGEVFTAISNPY